jgi:4-amino-4-deoxychorismate lyase
MFLLNGKAGHCVDVLDRGFQYGDGLFETIEVLKSTPLFLKQHLARLAEGCRKLLIPPPDASQLTAEAFQLSANVEKAVLKIIVTRGIGGRGYRQPESISPTRLLSVHPHPEYPDSFQSEGIVARFCQQRLSSSENLAGIKHLNRLEQVLARAEWQDNAIQEGLMLDNVGHVIEGTMSNLFFVRDEILHTPCLLKGGVKGILRKMVIDFAQLNNIRLVEKQFDNSEVLAADEMFVTNSVIGIWPVKQLDQQCFAIGAMTRNMQQWYAQARFNETRL